MLHLVSCILFVVRFFRSLASMFGTNLVHVFPCLCLVLQPVPCDFIFQFLVTCCSLSYCQFGLICMCMFSPWAAVYSLSIFPWAAMFEICSRRIILKNGEAAYTCILYTCTMQPFRDDGRNKNLDSACSFI